MGFAIFTVFKAGFVFSARGGSGVVIAKLPDGSMHFLSADYFPRIHRYLVDWSAPSAIGTAGLGFGGQAGVEMTDFLIVLNSASVSHSSLDG
jgi:SH3 domain-containing YSC84-like protein 1